MGTQATSVAISEVVSRLEAIGLDEKDAVLYVQLWLRGPSKASDIAAATKLNRTEAYRSLDNLIARGFVTAGLARPTFYLATEPERVFEDALAHHVAKRTQIESAREVALESLRALRHHDGRADVKLTYRIIQGRSGIMATMANTQRRAVTSQLIASTHIAPTANTEPNSPLGATIQRASEGIQMKILLAEKPGMLAALAPLSGFKNVEIRFFDPGVPVRFTIVDDRELLFWLASDPSSSANARGDVAMWTNAPDYVRTQRLFFDALWQTGRDPASAKPTPKAHSL